MDDTDTVGETVSRRAREGFETVTTRLSDAGEVVFRERGTMEHVLLLCFLVAASYMFWGASEFTASAATFPRLTAGATIVLSLLLLGRNYLPGPLRRFVAEPAQLLGGDEDDGDADDQPTEETTAGAYTYDIDDPWGPAVTAGLCVLYLGLTFTIGMLYATPIFVALFAWWAGIDRRRSAALVGVGFLTALVFYLVIAPEIAVGWYTGWEPPAPLFVGGGDTSTSALATLTVLSGIGGDRTKYETTRSSGTPADREGTTPREHGVTPNP
ncbi:hypothetical protein C483_04289 [Natrialba hulunbeirensis JCM 10989]|uniref:DUF1468 domain-containing protein n=1 Tax=Natrialba hulunbeirensis JCM 10989 TaxID=1227493 RepID=M0A7J6_9EURY|nr:tripartite tricarboxylate transporter TctB family protein [Natrialba hulunbeirensis]ELY93867.1 hypothetical protein C483_04289 [Natrialba hulunbeirensis JCM 10989]